MKQSNGFRNSDNYQSFDNEQHLRRLARKRIAKSVRCIPVPETQDWMFLTDLDEAIDQLTCQLEVQSCH